MRSTYTLPLIMLMSAMAFVYACNKGGFKGHNDSKAAEQDLSFSCQQGEQASNATQDISGLPGSKLSIKGQFCKAQLTPVQPSINIIFTVDYSGSMATADPGNGITCARLDAARAIIEKLMPSSATPGRSVKAGIVGFDAVAQPVTPVEDIALFKLNALTHANFCGQRGASTNYEAAFGETKKMIDVVQGPKLVLLFSDGLPKTYGDGRPRDPDGQTVVSDEAERRGKTAAAALRAVVDTKLKIAYLQYTGPDAAAENPQGYLTEVAGGNPQDVQVASNAAQFVEQVKNIELPPAVEVKGSNATAILRAAGFAEKSVRVTIKESSTTGIWNYETDPFELYGNAGAITLNELIVTAMSSDKNSLSSTTKINFRQVR